MANRFLIIVIFLLIPLNAYALDPVPPQVGDLILNSEDGQTYQVLEVSTIGSTYSWPVGGPYDDVLEWSAPSPPPDYDKYLIMHQATTYKWLQDGLELWDCERSACLMVLVAPTDSDGDGLPDDCDPKPYDADPFGYFRSFYQHDEQGNVTYEWLVLSDGTDVQMGSYYSGDGVQGRICIDDGKELSTLHLDWAEKYCAVTVSPTFGQQQYSHAPAVSGATLAAGEIGVQQSAWTDKVGELESQLVGDPSSDVLKSMLQEAEAVEASLNAELSKAIAELSAAVSDLIAEIEGGGDDFNAALLAQEARADTAAASAEQKITAATPGATSYNTDLDAVDTTDAETAFHTAADNLQQNSPLSSISNNIGVQLTGATSSFTVHALGKDIPFDFSPYESFYDVMGTLFIGICYLSAFLIVARS